MTPPRTRLAPSPTGALHLGNARTFLINWALARRGGWSVTLRIEDLDTPRTKVGADQQAIDDLRWLGMDWDDGPVHQLTDLEPYHAALRKLADAGLIYPCSATRKQITAALSAPHEGDDHEVRYPGINRPPEGSITPFAPADDGAFAWRLRVPDKPVVYNDCFAGAQSVNVQQSVGDFVVCAKSGLPAYQLAVVVDDARQGITHVVRGDDLIRSTPRQLLLYRLLGLPDPPRYTHVPLVLGADGHRLAKRHGDTRVSQYRERGVPADRLVGLLGHWSGLGDRRLMSAHEFADRFTLDALPPSPVTFTEDDDRWLTETPT